VDEPEADEAEGPPEAEEQSEAEEAPKPKKRTRRGSRGGRNRKKPATTGEAAASDPEAGAASEEVPEPERAVTIHVPGDDLGRPEAAEQVEEAPAEAPEPEAAGEPATAEAADGDAAASVAAKKKKTRRGSRGGRNRKKKPATASTNGADAGQAPSEQPQPDAEPASENGDFEYVPMSEWADEIESGR
jgi:ribonuclease E